MDLRQLGYVVAVADPRRFTRAAEADAGRPPLAVAGRAQP